MPFSIWNPMRIKYRNIRNIGIIGRFVFCIIQYFYGTANQQNQYKLQQSMLLYEDFSFNIRANSDEKEKDKICIQSENIWNRLFKAHNEYRHKGDVKAELLPRITSLPQIFIYGHIKHNSAINQTHHRQALSLIISLQIPKSHIGNVGRRQHRQCPNN